MSKIRSRHIITPQRRAALERRIRPNVVAAVEAELRADVNARLAAFGRGEHDADDLLFVNLDADEPGAVECAEQRADAEVEARFDGMVEQCLEVLIELEVEDDG